MRNVVKKKRKKQQQKKNWRINVAVHTRSAGWWANYTDKTSPLYDLSQPRWMKWWGSFSNCEIWSEITWSWGWLWSIILPWLENMRYMCTACFCLEWVHWVPLPGFKLLPRTNSVHLMSPIVEFPQSHIWLSTQSHLLMTCWHNTKRLPCNQGVCREAIARKSVNHFVFLYQHFLSY